MPVYQYACTACDERLEVRQSFTDDALTTCPVCAGRLRKVLSAVGVVFKGSGFYRNDSRTTSAPSESGASGDTGGAEGSGSTDGGGKAASADKKDGASNGTPSSGSGKDAGPSTPSTPAKSKSTTEVAAH